MSPNRSSVRTLRPGTAWRPLRAQKRRTAAAAPPPPSKLRKAMDLGGYVLIATGLSLLLTSAVTPGASRPALSDEAGLAAVGLAGVGIGLVIVFAIEGGKSKGFGWVIAACLVAMLNVLVVPWIVTVTFALPAPFGMPMLMLSFWTSLAAIALLFAVRLHLLDPKSLVTFIAGGSVGLAGLALLITQVGSSGGTYETTIPIGQDPADEKLDMRHASTGGIVITLRYDGGHMQRAYFERGQLRITRPVYFRYLDYTIRHEAPVGPEFTARTDFQEMQTYSEALKSLATMGLVRNPEAGVTLQ